MQKRSRATSGGDIVRGVTGVVLIVMGLMIWGQNADDLGTLLSNGRSSLGAGFLVGVCILGGIGLLLVGLFWRGSERRR